MRIAGVVLASNRSVLISPSNKQQVDFIQFYFPWNIHVLIPKENKKKNDSVTKVFIRFPQFCWLNFWQISRERKKHLVEIWLEILFWLRYSWWIARIRFAWYRGMNRLFVLFRCVVIPIYCNRFLNTANFVELIIFFLLL